MLRVMNYTHSGAFEITLLSISGNQRVIVAGIAGIAGICRLLYRKCILLYPFYIRWLCILYPFYMHGLMTVYALYMYGRSSEVREATNMDIIKSASIY